VDFRCSKEEGRDQEVESEVREEEVCVWGKDVESEWLGVVYIWLRW
jgi:hypothetical protein